jgi:carbonic anhydrase
MTAKEELLVANAAYAAAFEFGDLGARPTEHYAIVTCMDARIVPATAFGVHEGNAHIIRNAGGLVTDDALRSLVISHWELGTQEVFVIAHTGCGMQTFTNEAMREKLAARGVDASAIDFQPFADVEESVRESVRRVRESPLLPDSFTATGFVYDVKTGRLREID